MAAGCFTLFPGDCYRERKKETDYHLTELVKKNLDRIGQKNAVSHNNNKSKNWSARMCVSQKSKSFVKENISFRVFLKQCSR